jgi:hypothetical protein
VRLPRILFPLSISALSCLGLVVEIQRLLQPPNAPVRPLSKSLLADVRAASPDHEVLRGWVRWPNRTPARGASVSLRARDPAPRIPTLDTTTDEDGFFRFTDVEPAIYDVECFVWSRSILPRSAVAAGRLDRVDSAAFEVRMTLVRLLPTGGRVVDDAGRPLSGVEVLVTTVDPRTPCPGIQDRDVSGRDGEFTVWAPEGSFVDLEAARLDFLGDLTERRGPLGWASAVRAGSSVNLEMPAAR